jgi:hypothetical protein
MATTRYDKLLVTHAQALRRKYGAGGYDAIRDALDLLVKADAARGLRSRVLLLDNAQSMRAIGSARVADGDWVATLRAVDLACTRYTPAYLALVGATDVVPQAQVHNPVAADDPDPYVPSDLPFACDLPDSWTGPAGGAGDRLSAGDLLAVTRVVGRIPDLVGATDPEVLLTVLATAASYTQRPAGSYQKVFALSAAAWQGSTELSVDLLPGPRPRTFLSPSEATPWTVRQVSGLTHFVNCHGADTGPDWWGQASGGPVDVVALAPEDIAHRIAEGTVVAAECCYGAMHYAPGALAGRLPLLIAYLASGGYAGVGSTTTSYGPADDNGQADLVCRFVLEGILAGASTGRALLDARQRYLRETGVLTPVDLKTLVQFDLLGDPSIVPAATGAVVPKAAGTARAPGAPGAAPQVATARLAQRRVVLAATGRALDASVARAGRRRPGVAVGADRLAREAGVRRSQVAGPVTSYGEHGRGRRAGARYYTMRVRANGREGLVVAREIDGERQTRSVWRR